MTAKEIELEKLAKHFNDAYLAEHQECVDALSKLSDAEDMNKALLHRYLKCKEVINELIESAEHWNQYDVPLGIVKRMKEAVK